MRKVLFILGQLSDSDVEWIITKGSKRVIPAETVLIHEGKHIDSIFIMLEGELSVTISALEGKEIARLGSGEIVGEMSLVDGQPPMATVASLKDSTVFAIPRRALASKLESDTGFAARFYRALAVFLSDRMRNTVRRLGYGERGQTDEEAEMIDELSPSVLDTVYLAGSRFDRMLKRLMAS